MPLALLDAPFDDHGVGSRVLAGLAPRRQLPPRRAGVAAARRATLAAAHRMVDGVHGHAAVVGAPPLPARAPRLADVHAGVLDVADLADGGAALEVDAAGLARRQPHLPPVALLGHERAARA